MNEPFATFNQAFVNEAFRKNQLYFKLLESTKPVIYFDAKSLISNFNFAISEKLFINLKLIPRTKWYWKILIYGAAFATAATVAKFAMNLHPFTAIAYTAVSFLVSGGLYILAHRLFNMEKVPRWAHVALNILLTSAVIVVGAQFLLGLPLTYLGTATMLAAGQLTGFLGQTLHDRLLA